MTKYSKVNGKYLIKGKSYEMLTGSRAQVYHGTAYKTSGNLKKSDLIQNKHGRIVSSSKYKLSKQKGKNNLFNKGYTARKGKFGAVRNGVSLKNHRITTRRHRRKSHRGGNNAPGNESGGGDAPPAQPTVGLLDAHSSLLTSASSLVGGNHNRSRSASKSRSSSRSLASSRSRAKSLASRGGLFLG
jgi:hypothetical protein